MFPSSHSLNQFFRSFFFNCKKKQLVEENEEKFRVLFDNIPVMAYVIDKDHRYIACNKASADFFSGSIGKKTLEIDALTPEIRKLWHKAEEQVIASGKSAWYIEKSKSRYGQGNVYYENWLNPVKDKNGKVSLMIGVSHNITHLKQKFDIANHRKRMLEELVRDRMEELEKTNQKLQRKIAENEVAQKALKESENKYRMLVETLNDCLVVYDESGVITFINERVCEVLGFMREEIIGKEMSAFIHEDSMRIFKHNANRKKLGSSEKYRAKFLKKNNEVVDVIISSRPIFDTWGNYKGTLGVIMDTTELKETESRLFELYKHLGTINLQVSVLLDVHKFSNNAVDQDKIKDYVLVSALSLSNADIVALYSFNKESSNFELISSVNKEGEDNFEVKTIAGNLPNMQKIREKRTTINGSILDAVNAADPLSGRFSYYLALPLTKGEELGGMLIFGYYGKNERSIHELDLYEAFAAQVSFVLYNSNLIR